MRSTILLLASMALTVVLASGVVLLSASVRAQELTNKPNIVFIYADDMRYDELAKVQSLAGFADQGTEFSSAYVTNSVCCPSRTTALTGQYSHTHGVLSNAGGEFPVVTLPTGHAGSGVTTWAYTSSARATPPPSTASS